MLPIDLIKPFLPPGVAPSARPAPPASLALVLGTP
jgi:hypothetical protein